MPRGGFAGSLRTAGFLPGAGAFLRLAALCNSVSAGTRPDAEVRMHLVYLKHWTLNLMPLMVYPKVLFHLNFSIKGNTARAVASCKQS